MDEKRAVLDDNIGKISTKAFLNQRPVLAKLGDDVKKIIQDLVKKSNKQKDDQEASKSKSRILQNLTQLKDRKDDFQNLEDLVNHVDDNGTISIIDEAQNDPVLKPQPIVPQTEEREEMLDKLEHFLEELKNENTEDIDFQNIIGAGPAMTVDELTKNIEEDNPKKKKLNPWERLKLLKNIIKMNLKKEKPIAAQHEDVKTEEKIDENLKGLKSKEAPSLKMLKMLK
jgi:hypothetical protein